MIGLKYSLATIAEAVGGRLVNDQPESVDIDRLITDSRNADATAGTLFIALRGPRNNGHDHLAELWDKGIRNFLVEESQVAKAKHGNLIVVADALDALQRFAAHHRARFSIPVIGITGSNGKTVVKEWLWQMLHHEENIVRSPGSWNSQVGVPLSVLRMGPEHTLGIFEAGISQPGEMEKLEPIIRPTIGVLTNIGSAHDEGFGGDRALKEEEKKRLFTRCPQVLAPLEASRIDVTEAAATVEMEHAGLASRFVLPFNDTVSISNAVTCIGACLRLGRSPMWINARLAQLTPVDMRMRTVHGAHGTTLIDDSYSLDETSLSMALDTLKRLAHGRQLVTVLSDMSGSNEDAQRLYAGIAAGIERCGVHQVFGIGPAITAHGALFGTNARFYPDTDALLAEEDPKQFAGAVILIKGARRFGFERIVERWQQQVHGTELEIDLDAVRHNLNHYRSLLAPGVRTMAMVKAFGYGAGAVELARLFQHERVNYLGVAYADEGIELRSHGITLPIMVMNPEPVAMETLHRFRLEAEVFDQRSLREAIAAARQMPDAPPVHIKLDTGMRRLGFSAEELPMMLDPLRDRGALRVASILTHLVASEDAAQDEFTRAQIAAFTRMADSIDRVLGYRPLRHMANSAAVTRWPQAHFDMVRLGIGLHGIGATPEETPRLRNVASLRTVIAQIKPLSAGDTVGYGRRGVAQLDGQIATIPMGYADGLSRRLSNGVGRFWVNGTAAPIMGTVCMDMCMIDVTGIPCAVGDAAMLFDAEHPITELARDMGTIPYEVLTGIPQRVKRVYLHG